MTFKGKLWETEKLLVALKKEQSNIVAVELKDKNLKTEFLEIFFKIFPKDELKRVGAEEVSYTWIEDNLNALSFFQTDSYLFSNSENFKEEIQRQWMQLIPTVTDRKLVFLFNKADKFFKQLSKLAQVSSLSVVSPSFWEGDKLFDFLASKKGLKFAPQTRQYILERIPNEYQELAEVISRLQLLPKGELISLDQVKELIETSRVDHFMFADLLGARQVERFYLKLLELAPSDEELRKLFYFLQTHMVKLSYPQEILLKEKRNNYENKLLSQGQRWSEDEVHRVLSVLKNIEFMAKTKDPLTIPLLQKHLLQIKSIV